MVTRVKGRLRAAQIAVAVAAIAGLLPAFGCSTARQEAPKTTPPGRAEQGFDPGTLAWMPSALQARLPAVVGWRQTGAQAGGELVAISRETSPQAVWEAPTDVACRVAAFDAARGTLVTVVEPAAGGSARPAAYLSAPDGTVTPIVLPKAYDTASAFAFASDGRAIGLLALYGTESIEATLGVVAGDGSWRALRLTGTLPRFQYVENIFAVPGTDVVAVVLKTQGTPANRDDEALVLARISGDEIRSFTTPLGEDSLPNAVPLWGADGVLFVRTWRSDAARGVVADLVRATYADGRWVEDVLVEGGDITTGIESGSVAVAMPDGTVLVRSPGQGGESDTQTLLQVGDGGRLSPTGMDVTGATGLVWVTE